MSGNHSTTHKSDTCNLQPIEAHIASICVAIVFGTIGGFIGVIFLMIFSNTISLLIAVFGGFLIPWIVCKYLFKTAHLWYGQSSLYHRAYDSVGVLAAIATFYIHI